MNKLMVISLDAISSNEMLKKLAKMPNFSKLLKQGTLVKDVESVFVSNTYVCHTSMITGVYPNKHQIIDNTLFEKIDNPHWRWYYEQIKAPNIVEKALEMGYTICNLFWPVMAKAPIQYNLPEIIARDHENQIITILKSGTPWFIFSSLIKHINKFKGINQPSLDNISTAVACDVLKKQKCDLLLLHLTDTDMQKHFHGINSQETIASLERMDQRIGELITASQNNYEIVIVSDHSQIDIHTSIDLNQQYPIKNAHWYQSEGMAALLTDQISPSQLDKLNNWAKENPAIKKVVTGQELINSGLNTESQFVIVANSGFCFIPSHKKHLACHGFSLDIAEDYKVFYFAKGKNIKANNIISGGSILDICPLLTELLELKKWDIQGKLQTDMFIKTKK